MREAAAAWGSTVPEVAQVSRRVRLGCSLGDSLEAARPFFGGDLNALSLVAELHGRAGGNAAEMLEAIAGSIDQRVSGAGRAAVNAAGARLSARLVAGLPLAALLFLPGSRAPVFDPMGLTVIVAGIALCLGGMRWIGGLLPVPPDEVDEAGLLAVVIASAARSGCSVDQVLDLAAARKSGTELARAGRRHRLGLQWPDALMRSNDEALCSLGLALATPQRLGVPVAPTLDELARRRAEQLENTLERAIRRAPVKMVVPLTLCVLPSFALLALTPFLRSLAPP
jgi:tight adherence protein B